MVNMLDNACIWARVRLCKAKEGVKEFFSSQDGVAPVVATIVILLITVLLIAFFWEELQKWISGIMGDIFDEQFDDSGLSGGI